MSYVCLVCICLDLSVSSSSWALGRAAVCDCGTPWAFLLPFLNDIASIYLTDVLQLRLGQWLVLSTCKRRVMGSNPAGIEKIFSVLWAELKEWTGKRLVTDSGTKLSHERKAVRTHVYDTFATAFICLQ